MDRVVWLVKGTEHPAKREKRDPTLSVIPLEKSETLRPT